MRRLMSALFAAVLLFLPSVSLAQGNAFGGGGIPTDSSQPIYTDGTDLILSTAGASLVTSPLANTGSEIVFSEGSAKGVNTLTLNVGSEGLATNVSFTFNSLGALPSTCPIFKWYQPSRMAVKLLTIDPVGTSYEASLSGCHTGGSCQLPFAELVTNGPETTYTSPGATCSNTTVGNCSKPISIGGAAETTWDLSVTVTILATDAQTCEITVWEDFTNPITALDLTLGDSALDAVGETVTVTTTVVVAAGDEEFYGAYRARGATATGCGSPSGWGVEYIFEAVKDDT